MVDCQQIRIVFYGISSSKTWKFAAHTTIPPQGEKTKRYIGRVRMGSASGTHGSVGNRLCSLHRTVQTSKERFHGDLLVLACRQKSEAHHSFSVIPRLRMG